MDALFGFQELSKNAPPKVEKIDHMFKKPIPVPNHKVLGKGLLLKLLRDVDIPIEDFVKLL